MSTQEKALSAESKKVNDAKAPAKEAAKTPTAASQPVYISKVKANFHLIIQPTKIFEATDPDRVTLLLDGEEKEAHVFDPFDIVSVVPKNINLNPQPEKIAGFFRLTLFPALNLISEFNQNAVNGLLKIGTAKETETFYKELAVALSKKVDAVMPSVSGYLSKSVQVSKAADNSASFDWNIDIFAFYRYRGALVEDVVPHVTTIINAVHGLKSNGKPAKNPALPNTGLTISIAVDAQEAHTLATGVDLSNFEYSTSFGSSLYTPTTKALRKTLFGASPYNAEEVIPLLIFTKEA